MMSITYKLAFYCSVGFMLIGIILTIRMAVR